MQWNRPYVSTDGNSVKSLSVRLDAVNWQCCCNSSQLSGWCLVQRSAQLSISISLAQKETERKERVYGTLIVALLVFAAVYYKLMEHHAISVVIRGDAYSNRTPKNGSGYSALSEHSMKIAVGVAGLVATLMAGEFQNGTFQGYLCVIGCEASSRFLSGFSSALGTLHPR